MSQVEIRVCDNINGTINRMTVEGASVGEVVGTVLSGLDNPDVSVTYERRPLAAVDQTEPVVDGATISVAPKKVEGGV